ncbi:MAG: DUF86 domain-containing protein [Pseudomonadota bacterium]
MRQDRLYLQHILDAIAKIESYSAVGREQFIAQSLWHDAAIRQLEIFGEASKKLSTLLKEAHPQIPWRRVAGLRDVLIHEYFGVDLAMVWAVIQRDLPALKQTVTAMLASQGGEQ